MKRILTTLKEKWPEYILEILVIIVGIYGAFALERWNEQVKNKTNERDILAQMVEELQTNLRDVSGDLIALERYSVSELVIQNALERNLEYQDQFCFDFDLMIRDEYTTANQASYDQLKEIGFNIITDDTIRWLIMDIYENSLPRLARNTAFFPDLGEFFGPYYNQHFIPNSDTALTTMLIHRDTVEYPIKVEVDNRFLKNKKVWQTFGYVPLNFTMLKNDPEFKMLMSRSKRMRSHKLMWYKRTEGAMKEVCSRIKLELEKE